MSEQELVHYQTFVYDSARWRGFRFRDGDIVISTPPKCGTTWTQRICALLILQKPELDQPLSHYSPWIDMVTHAQDEVLSQLESQTHRRFIKSHTPMDGIPFDECVTYLCIGRDPRDVALSWDNHLHNADYDRILALRDEAVGNQDIAQMLEVGPPPLPESEAERFWLWIEDPSAAAGTPSSLVATLHHLQSFYSRRHLPNVVLLHYDEMKRDLEGSMRRLARCLGIGIEESLWPALVRAASFEEMKREADKTAPNASDRIWQDNKQFFRSGSSRQWQRLFGEGDEARYQRRLRELASEDFAAWLHGETPAL